MPLLPDDIAKVHILKRVDELSRDPVKRDAFLTSLEDRSKHLAAILVEHGALMPGAEERHYRNHWFNENGRGWWRDSGHQAHIHDVLRDGLIRAFQEAKAHNLPVDSYWIRVGNQFAMYVMRSPEQVTRIIVTPNVPAGPMPAAALETPGSPDPIWIIKGGDGASK